MTYFVCDDALELIAVEAAEEACGYSNGGSFRFSAGCKGIGCGVVDDINFGHRQGGGDFHFLDDVEKLRMNIVGDWFGFAGE